MNGTAIPAELRLQAPALAARLALVLVRLAALVAHALLRNPRLAPMIPRLATYINRTAQRFTALAARVEAGTPSRPRRPRPGQKARPRKGLPRGHGWLIRAIGYQAAGVGVELQHILIQPGVAAFFAATPAASRLLRPLAHMLAVTDAYGTPAAASILRPPGPARPARTRPPAACNSPAAPPDHGRSTAPPPHRPPVRPRARAAARPPWRGFPRTPVP